MTTWPLSELTVNELDGRVAPILLHTTFPLPQSPLVAMLMAGHQIGPNTEDYKYLLGLYEDIRENGVKNPDTIRISENNEIHDGHHRLSILFFLGEEAITLPDNQTVKK